MGKNNGRDWGYGSYDVDNDKNENLTYTSYERNGRVNRYTDNGDGGHTHGKWNDKDDYNSGKDPDWSRSTSNRSENPSTGDIQRSGGCYLTSACMKHFKEKFDDKCYELEVLRWFRDNFVSKEDIKHYYEIAPQIVLAISQCGHDDIVYDYIYDNVVDACVNAIENGDYEFAYNRYKSSILSLEESFVKPLIQENSDKVLKKALV